MPFVFPILINEDFSEAYMQIPILMLGSVFNILVSFIGSIYVAKKLTKEIAKVSIFAGVINIVTNLLMIKFIGLYAASISTLFAYLIMFILRFIDVKKYVNLKLNKNIIISLIVLFIVAFVVFYLKNRNLEICSAVVVTIYAVIINKSSAKFVFESVVSKFAVKHELK